MFGRQMGMGLGALGMGAAGLMSGGGSNPAAAAQPYYGQVAQTISPYFNPYIQAGQQALPQLQGQYGQLMNNPNAFLKNIGSGYQQSPGYQWQLGQGMNAANNAAAAGGMLGSPQNQQQAATMATGLANQDYYNYMQQALGAYGTGLSGLQGLGTQGYGAASQLGTDLASNLMSQGNLAYSGQAAQNQAQGNLWGDVFGGAGMLLGAFL